MLVTNDVVAVRGKDKVLIGGEPVPFKRIWFSFGPQDPIEDSETEVQNGEETFKAKITAPKNGKTAGDPSELLSDTLAYLQGENKTTEGYSPILHILQLAEQAYVLQQRHDVRSATEEKFGVKKVTLSPKTLDKARIKLAEKLVANGKAADLTAALAAMEALGI